MAILIGVDEAGYGPNLGPLVVAASAWEVVERVEGAGRRAQEKRAAASAATMLQTLEQAAASPPAQRDLYALLAAGVTRGAGARGAALSRNRGAGREPVAIADSKVLYKPGWGLRNLERGVLAAWATLAESRNEESRLGESRVLYPRLSETRNWRATDFIEATGADPHDLRRRLPWHAEDARELPVDATPAEVADAATLLGEACAGAGVRLMTLRARLVHPHQFNALVDEHGTKGAALSHVTLGLVREVVDGLVDGRSTGGGGESDANVQITCDKHGGRSFYAALLQHHFAESWVEVLGEARAASSYAWEHRGARCHATFRVGGEAELPTALASMTAKYLRELAMREFNAWWGARVPGLKPTAGYPLDARRFKAAIAAVQAQLAIEDCALWRDR